MRAWGVAAAALLLSGCAGGLVPPSAGGGAPYYPAPASRPAPAQAPNNAPGIPPVGSNAGSRPAAGAPVLDTPGVLRPVGAGSPIAPLATAPVSATAATAVAAGVLAAPPLSALRFDDEEAARALTAYRLSCPSLANRTDQSGLTRNADWRESCDAARDWPARSARDFFDRFFAPVQVGDGRAFATGYYEPEIHGSRDRRRGYEVPVYGKPADLIDVDLGAFSDELAGKKIRGRVDGSNFVPYFDRTEIEAGALNGRGLEIAWAADPIEVFFLQIQGSGRLRLPDGGVMRVGYAGQNGRSYTGIGGLMRDRGLLEPGQASMQGIMAWLRAHPEEGKALMRENKSFVFFRELTGPGPLGAMGYPVVGSVSVAADPKFVPLGAPVYLSMDRSEATGLWVAQDTGGAIRGANRFDTFWGAGDDARTVAGGMSARGTAFVLLPRSAAARLTRQ